LNDSTDSYTIRKRVSSLCTKISPFRRLDFGRNNWSVWTTPAQN
jgi:hypothetical protein